MRDFLKQFFGGSADEELVTPVDTANAVRKSITVSGKVQPLPVKPPDHPQSDI